MRYLIKVFNTSKAHNFLAWGVFDKKHSKHYRLEIGIDNGFTLLMGREKAIEEICSVIYLSDNSGYIKGLWSALEALSPSVAEDLRAGKWKPIDE
jgi:hypothetical protein